MPAELVQPKAMPSHVVRIGVAGWSYPDWEGIVYPQPKPPRFDPLSFLVAFFDTIEINSTFYRPASPRMTSSWGRRCESNPQFRFTVKLFKGFTHDRTATLSDERLVKQGLEPLGATGRLGALLLQFPWSFKNQPEDRRHLEALLDRFREYPCVVEVRHASWDDGAFYDHLSDRGVGFCNIDQPRIGRSLAPSERTTGPVGYVRLHGRNYQDWFREGAGRDARYDYLYDEEELTPWLDKIEQVAEDSIETYVIANNHYRGKAVVNALQIKSRRRGGRVPAPSDLVAAYPVLKRVVTEPQAPAADQGRLF